MFKKNSLSWKDAVPFNTKLKKILMPIVLISLSFFILGWLILSILVYFFQSHFVFFPSKHISCTPQAIGLKYTDVQLKTEDGLRLHAWYLPHPQERAKLLFMHGNAGNICHRLDSLRLFHNLGLSVLIYDYRGYGRSEGVPSEQGTYQDALATWRYLDTELNQDKKPVFLFGRSLGTGVASWLATQVSAKALIMESGFTSIMDMGKHYFPYIPVYFLTRIRYDSLSRIDKIHYPILFIHSPADDLVPYHFSRALYERAKTNKTFVDIQGDHNTGFLTSGAVYTEALQEFISRALEGDQTPH